MSRFAVVPTYWLRHLDLSTTDKAVLAVLATYAGADGYCWPSVPVLATCLAVSERTVQRSLQVLTEAGAVKMKRRYDEDGRVTSNGYWVRGYDNKPPVVAIHGGEGDTHVTGDGDTHVTGMVTPMSPKQYQLKQDQLEQATTPPAAAALSFPHPDVQEAYEGYRAQLRNGRAFDATLRSVRDGMTTGKPVSMEVLGLAILEMAGNGELFNVSRLRGYIRKHEAAALQRPTTEQSKEQALEELRQEYAARGIQA